MWDQGGFGAEQGGFLSSPAQFSSPSDGAGERKSVRRAQNLVPVTVQQILESSEDGLKIGDIDIQLVTVVGVVKSVETASTKITYHIEDNTGLITAVLWLEGEPDSNDSNHPPVVENTYCRIIGSVRSQQGKRHVMIFKILPLKDLNELTTHILEVIHCNLKVEQLQQKELQTAAGPANPQLANSFVGANIGNGASSFGFGGGANGGLNAQQQLVYRTIQSCSSEAGIHKNQIYGSLRGKIPNRDIDKMLEFLSGEGHIYSTVDEDHYRATDS